MRKCLLAVLFVAVVRLGLGQDIASSKSPPPSAAAYASAAAENDQDVPQVYLTKADHLRVAAEHLDAAGLKDEAQRVRQKAAEEETHAKTTPASQVVVNLRMLEYSPTKLGKLSAQKYGGSKDMSVLDWLSKLQPSDGLAPASPKLLPLIEALRKDGFVHILSEPTLATVPDRHAYCLVGGKCPYREKDSQGKEITKWQEYGTRVDLMVHTLSPEWVHLDFHLRVSELDGTNSGQDSDEGIPAMRTREVETGVKVRLGQTMVLNGGVQQRTLAIVAPPDTPSDKLGAGNLPGEVRHVVNDTQTLVLFNAEIVAKGISETAAAKPAARR